MASLVSEKFNNPTVLQLEIVKQMQEKGFGYGLADRMRHYYKVIQFSVTTTVKALNDRSSIVIEGVSPQLLFNSPFQ